MYTAILCESGKRIRRTKLAICTVIGFPNGYSTTAAKCFETEDAIKNGADEIDMVINIGWLKDKKYDSLLQEIKQIKVQKTKETKVKAAEKAFADAQALYIRLLQEGRAEEADKYYGNINEKLVRGVKSPMVSVVKQRIRLSQVKFRYGFL